MTIKEKYNKLKEIIKKYEKVAIAFSGGVDSSFLSKLTFDILKENSMAITIFSPFIPEFEYKESIEIANQIGIKHSIIKINELNEEIIANKPERCYLCKKIVFSKIKEEALKNNIKIIFDGSNIDDLSDYRPGMKALEELEIISPLKESGLSKNEIRELSKELNLKTWNKPAYACLATRVAYGEKLTNESLKLVEKSEDFIRNLGFNQFRLRKHGEIARLEISEDEREKIFDKNLMDTISKELKSYGFIYVCLEMGAYQSGSMNKILNKNGGINEIS